ncbi:MAG: T9SS type A sorting domain-containing protein [Flavobacteriales bacterium]|nr:T9SS type A sorting domain-containing protein [Flavobacteriales bacterium]
MELVADPFPAKGSSWVLRNALGQQVLRETVRGQRTWIDLSALNEGVYLVQLEGTSSSQTQRLMVVR